MCHRSESYVNQILKENDKLREENKRLRAENAKLKQRIEEIENKLSANKSTRFYPKPNVQNTPKKPGQKKGHKGCGRRIPERIDETVELETNTCPHCNTELHGKTVEIRQRYVVDIIPVKPKVTEYKSKRKYCPKCRKLVSERPKDVIPRARLGLNLLLFIAFHKYVVITPVNKICTILEKYYGIHVSTATVINELNLLAKAFGKDFRRIIDEMRHEHSVHADETGYRVGGINNWLWGFISKTRALFLVRNSRGSKVPKEVLGEDFKGVLTSDFWNAYNWVKNQQKCWSHVLRKTEDMVDDYILHYKLSKLYRKAKRLEKANMSKRDKLVRVAELEREVEKLRLIPFSTKEAKAFANTLAKHKGNLFRFVTDKEVDATNNDGERPLRHLVTMRKVCGGSRSENGARVLEVNMSVIQTWKLQGRDFFEEAAERLREFSEN